MAKSQKVGKGSMLGRGAGKVGKVSPVNSTVDSLMDKMLGPKRGILNKQRFEAGKKKMYGK